MDDKEASEKSTIKNTQKKDKLKEKLTKLLGEYNRDIAHVEDK